ALIKKNNIKFIRHSYSKEYLKDFKAVISATDNREINQMVHDDCRKEGIIINVVDTPELCDFILPASVKRDELTISVSTQGQAPFLAKDIKQRLEHLYSDFYKDIVKLAGKFRNEILKNKKFDTKKKKSDAFNKFLMMDWKRIIRSEGIKKATAIMNGMLKDLQKNK
ncbi:MAG: bifunctional precorrin-2 dehydrogenase/sirohydrochlorin ferrochelatase, partial [Ignavibacteria bacterium]